MALWQLRRKQQQIHCTLQVAQMMQDVMASSELVYSTAGDKRTQQLKEN